ncbi:DUF1090 family protein [Geminicoccus flavidas]|uniref:DUF1090 family protein n=1 Tax=Geminicoccus flavidas TaxID=2506407 RepID=UPI001356BA7C|nr:DUF1090 family protein [Geminicoccus flavidas]
MKLLLLATALLTLPALATTAQAQELRGCAARVADLEIKRDEARSAGEIERADGLQKAVVDAKETCDDARLRAEREERVAEKRREVEEDKEDLARAEREGDWGDIEDARRDLREAQWELEEAEADLDR